MKPVAAVLAIIIATAAVTAALASHEGAYTPTKMYPRGGIHGGDAWVIPMGQLQGLRDIQGGRHTGRRADLNLDIGAGSTAHPGTVAINFDVGRAFVIYDGRKRKLASFSRRGIRFYRRPLVSQRHR